MIIYITGVVITYFIGMYLHVYGVKYKSLEFKFMEEDPLAAGMCSISLAALWIVPLTAVIVYSFAIPFIIINENKK